MEGHYGYRYEQFWKDYAITYSETDAEDKKALFAMLSESFKLEVYEKRNFFQIITHTYIPTSDRTRRL